jgi:ActR/RegA family two-component response regulator
MHQFLRDLRRIGEEFPERIVEPLAIPRGSLPPDTPELKLSRLLQNYRKQREERLIREGAGKRELNAERLVITNLQKRLLSSIEAFARTLKVHQRSLAEKQEQRRGALAISGAQLDLLLGGADRDSDLSELSEEDLLNLEEAQTRAALRQTVQADQSELELLKQMGEIAEANRHRPDPRNIRLEAFLRTNLCANLGAAGARWQPTRLLIFTDYVDTKRYLEQELRILLAEDDPDLGYLLRRVLLKAGYSCLLAVDGEAAVATFRAHASEVSLAVLRLLELEKTVVEGAAAKGHAKEILEKVWTDWEAFAQYAFNKSHSTCYAYVAYETAYLKAHYPGEYMSAVLNNAGSIEKITFFYSRPIECTTRNPKMTSAYFIFNFIKNISKVSFNFI